MESEEIYTKISQLMSGMAAGRVKNLFHKLLLQLIYVQDNARKTAVNEDQRKVIVTNLRLIMATASMTYRNYT